MKYFIFLALLVYTSVSCEQSPTKPVQAAQESTPSKQMSSQKSATSQNSSYGDDMAKIFQAYKSINSPKRNIAALESSINSISNEALKHAGDFVLELGKPTHNLLSDKFLKKPSIETLKAMHQIKMLMWNSFTPEAFDVKANLKTIEMTGLTESELLANYYIFIFNKISRENIQQDYSKVNFNFDQLNLKSPEEKAILYYTSLKAYNSKYNRAFRNSADPCLEAGKVIAKTPRYNGKTFAEFNAPAYQTFTITMNRQNPNQNFTDYFQTVHKKILENYSKCP